MFFFSLQLVARIFRVPMGPFLGMFGPMALLHIKFAFFGSIDYFDFASGSSNF